MNRGSDWRWLVPSTSSRHRTPLAKAAPGPTLSTKPPSRTVDRPAASRSFQKPTAGDSPASDSSRRGLHASTNSVPVPIDDSPVHKKNRELRQEHTVRRKSSLGLRSVRVTESFGAGILGELHWKYCHIAKPANSSRSKPSPINRTRQLLYAHLARTSRSTSYPTTPSMVFQSCANHFRWQLRLIESGPPTPVLFTGDAPSGSPGRLHEVTLSWKSRYVSANLGRRPWKAEETVEGASIERGKPQARGGVPAAGKRVRSNCAQSVCTC